MEVAEDGEFMFSRVFDDSEFRGEANRPASGGTDLVRSDAGVEGNDGEFTGDGVGPEEAEVRDDGRGTFTRQAEPLAVITALAESYRCDEVQLVYKGAFGLVENDEHLTCGACDLRSAPGTR
jgi:hypothetical protein